MSVKPVRSSKESVPATDNETEFDSTLDVLERARKGDGSAARVLIERTVGPLRRWARGRLPYYARAGANTEDVVQDAVLRALARVDHFEHRSVDGMQKYLRDHEGAQNMVATAETAIS